jgi:DNA repair exonuclease
VIRFIHTADLHLDRPFEGLSGLPGRLYQRVRESTFKALDRLTERTVAEHPDFMIIAGDIFDDSHRSLIAQRRFFRSMETLKDAGIPVYAVFGNHDHLDDPWNRLTLPENVHLFPVKPAVFHYRNAAGESADLHGFSYARRHIREDVVSHYSRGENTAYQIGILHGAQRSGNGEDFYAPFTVSELAEKGFDFWALGHIHKRQQLNPPMPAWYPGNIQGLSIKETGEKGASIVTLGKQGADVSFFSTADIIWQKKKLTLNGALDADRLESVLEQEQKAARRDQAGVFLQLSAVLSGTAQSYEELEQLFHEMTEAMNEGEEVRDHFVWFMAPRLTLLPEWDRERLLSSRHFIGDVFRLIEQDDSLADAASSLLNHRSGRRFLTGPDPDETEGIRQAAEELIAEHLIRQKQDD